MNMDKMTPEELAVAKHVNGEAILSQDGEYLLKGQVMMIMGSVIKSIREKFNPDPADKDKIVQFLGGLVTQAKDTITDNELNQKISTQELAYRLKLLDQELKIANKATPPDPNLMLKALALARTSMALSNIAGKFHESFKSAMADNGFGSRVLQ